MKRFVLLAVLLLVCATAQAERHNFFDNYDPAAVTFVYDDTGAAATGDEVAVNEYKQKTILICPHTVGESIRIQVEGRSKDQTDSPTWVILDTVDFGSASADSAKNVAVDVTEYVDFLRVGVAQADAAGGTSRIDIEGLFTTLER